MHLNKYISQSIGLWGLVLKSPPTLSSLKITDDHHSYVLVKFHRVHFK